MSETVKTSPLLEQLVEVAVRKFLSDTSPANDLHHSINDTLDYIDVSPGEIAAKLFSQSKTVPDKDKLIFILQGEDVESWGDILREISVYILNKEVRLRHPELAFVDLERIYQQIF